MQDFSSILDEAGRSSTEPTLRLGRLHSPSQQSRLKNLFSNLKDFLTERPVKIHPGASTAFAVPQFGTSMGENFKEFLRSGPRGRVNSELLVNWSDETSLWQNIRDLISPPKLPPLKTTSQPIPVPEIWSKDTEFNRAELVSLLLHAVAITLVVVLPLLLPAWFSPSPKASNVILTPLDTDISPYRAMLKPSAKAAGGGGGAHDNLPANKGRLPKFSLTQFTPPLVHPLEHPKLPMTPTVLGNPQINLPNINSPNWGDPLGKSANDSMGEGHGTGVGNGNGAGVGPGEGYGTGGGTPSAGTGGYGTPACLYCPKPEYSDEAMKVKVQGVVVLTAVITADGRATDIHVSKGLGLGLDEKAIEAVRTWRLTPARGPDGRPAAVRQTIELVFQLY